LRGRPSRKNRPCGIYLHPSSLQTFLDICTAIECSRDPPRYVLGSEDLVGCTLAPQQPFQF
jgi:hypothetical protein